MSSEHLSLRNQPATAPMRLYMSAFCGYCFRVKRAVERLGVPAEELEICDVTREPQLRREIHDATGRTTVPVLRVPRGADGQSQHGLEGLRGFFRAHAPDDDWLFESRDIVSFLTERYQDRDP